MALMDCSACGKSYSERNVACPHCGFRPVGWSREVQGTPPPIQKKAFTFLNAYWEVLKVLWTSPWWYVFVAAPFVFTGGKINHPERVIPGILFLGCVFFPFLGYIYFLMERAARRRGYRL